MPMLIVPFEPPPRASAGCSRRARARRRRRSRQPCAISCTSPPRTLVDRVAPGRPRSAPPPRRSGRRPRARSGARCSLRRRSTGARRRDGDASEAVRDGRRRRTPARTARRLPPKRCRIIGAGGPNATPVGATRAWLSSLWLALPRGPVDDAATVRSRSASGREFHCSSRPARGASARVEYLIRPARITDIERLVALSGGSVRAAAGGGSLDAARPAPPAGLPAAGEHLRRRSAARARRRRGPRPPAVRRGPAASSAPSTSSWSIPTTTRTA